MHLVLKIRLFLKTLTEEGALPRRHQEGNKETEQEEGDPGTKYHQRQRPPEDGFGLMLPHTLGISYASELVSRKTKGARGTWLSAHRVHCTLLDNDPMSFSSTA